MLKPESIQLSKVQEVKISISAIIATYYSKINMSRFEIHVELGYNTLRYEAWKHTVYRW